MGHGGWQGHRQYPEAKPFCFDPGSMVITDAEAAAINVLETTTYFQGKRSVDNYLDQFRDLIYDSGYTDPKGGTHSCNHYGLSTARGRLPTEFPTLQAHPAASP